MGFFDFVVICHQIVRKMKLYKNRNWLYEKYWKERLSTIEIAELCQVAKVTIWKWMKNYGIKARTLSEARKGKFIGEKSPLWGRKLPNKTKEKIRNALKGKYTKEKSSMYGIKGEAHHRWGVKHTEETKRIIGEKSRGRKQSKESIEKRMQHLRGKKRPPFSQEWKDNISKATEKLWTSPEYVKAVLYGRSNRPTKPEKIFNEMTPNVICYVGDGKLWRTLPNGKHKNPDFKIMGQNKVIEIFGGKDFFHTEEEAKELIESYKNIGLDCLIIWEHEIYNQPEIVKNQVNNFIF